MLSEEMRELVVKAYDELGSMTQVARIFGINKSTVCKYVHLKRDGKSFETKVHQRGRKSKLTQEDLDNIKHSIEQQPDITMHEINEKLALPVSDETVRRKVVEMGMVYKKKSLYASERNRSRCCRETRKMV